MSTTSKKILAPLATLLVAGAVAVGSGADFTSQSNNPTSAVTSGTLALDNSKPNRAVFNLDNMKPGDVLNGSLTITNTGSLPVKLSLTEKDSSSGFSDGALKLDIVNNANKVSVYSGAFGGLTDNAPENLGQINAHTSNSYTFTVTLGQNADYNDQGKSASATYEWNAVQLDNKTTTDQP